MLRLEDQCLELRTGVPMLAGVNLVTSKEFLEEYKLPGRLLRHCEEIDESLNCQYLSVERVHATTRQPVTTPKPTVAPITEAPRQTTTTAPIRTEPPKIETPKTTTPRPKITFDDYQPPNESKTRTGPEQKTSVLQRIFAYLMITVVTAAAVSLGYRWWQDQTRRRPRGPPQGDMADSSFLRQSPSSASASAKFSPSTSRGPTSSTPRARPLYTERFSTTLLTD